MSESMTIFIGSVPLKFIWCPPGQFRMGRYINPRKTMLHERLVEFTEGFWLLETPVTIGLRSAFGGYDDPYNSCHPLTGLSYFDVQEFCDKLKYFDGREFSLPTEAQWEYACACGTHSSIGGAKNLSSVAWFDHNAGWKLPAVKLRAPNKWGFYDMLGEVEELVLDDWQDWINPSRSQEIFKDYVNCGQSDNSGLNCVLKGGCVRSCKSECQVAYRRACGKADHVVLAGFRLVLK